MGYWTKIWKLEIGEIGYWKPHPFAKALDWARIFCDISPEDEELFFHVRDLWILDYVMNRAF